MMEASRLRGASATLSLIPWDCSENTSGFRAQDCHAAVTEDKLLISQLVGELSTNAGPIGCLWALGPECGSVGRECGPEASLVGRESGPVFALFVGPSITVGGPLQLSPLNKLPLGVMEDVAPTVQSIPASADARLTVHSCARRSPARHSWLLP
jgi:hypothetical protein